MTRTLSALALCFSTASLAVAAQPEWIAVTGPDSGTLFVDRASARMVGNAVTIQVMRNHEDVVALGTDPVTEEPLYPHRSVKVSYVADCEGQRIGLQSWEMYRGNLGHGDVVWADRYAGGPAFAVPSTTEEQFAYASACASKWAMLQ